MSTPVVVIGASGHAKVCIEILRAAGDTVGWCIAGGDGQASCADVPVLVGDHNLARLRDEGLERCFVAVGDNATRRRLGAHALAAGFELANAIHPRAVLSPSVQLGTGIAVMAGAIVNADTVLSDLAIINTGAVVDHDCWIGTAAHIAPGSALAGGVRVGDGSFLGIGSAVVPGIAVGRDAVVGAGATVISDVPDGATVVGVPARALAR